MAHPAVAEAAVIAVPDEKWGERPLAAVVLREGAAATADELREFLAPQFAKWWLPERFEFVDEIPKTSVGKFRKMALREQFAAEPRDRHAVESGRPPRGRRAVRAARGRRPRSAGRRGARARARGRDQLPRHPDPARPLSADAGVPGGARRGARGRARGRDARDGAARPRAAYAELAAVDRAPRSCRCRTARRSPRAPRFLLTFLTAYVPLTRQVRFEEERTVLVHAAAGGVGTAAIQVARALGARVVAAVGSPEKLDALPRARRRGGVRLRRAARTTCGSTSSSIRSAASCSRPRSRGCVRSASSWRSATRAGSGPSCSRRSSSAGTSASQGVYIGRLLRHAPDVVAAATRELLELWSGRRIRPFIGAEFPLAEVEQRARARRVAPQRRQGRAAPVRALVTGGRGGIGSRDLRAARRCRLRPRPAGVRRRRPGGVALARGRVRRRLPQRRDGHGCADAAELHGRGVAADPPREPRRRRLRDARARGTADARTAARSSPPPRSRA